MYSYNSSIYLAEVALNVVDLAAQTAFYHQIIGLEILEQGLTEVLLGAGGKPLVRLIQTSVDQPVNQSYGLYHMAILLPNRQALGDIFKHIAELKIPLVGGADHGYSEALYLEDLEGNGIELYRDKPVDVWDIREDGRIIGVTEELQAQDIYEMGRKKNPFVIDPDTRMGHVHLSVKNSSSSSQFYQTVLGLSDTFSIPSASWLASGGYHHHLAVNEWGGSRLDTRLEQQKGLAYYVVHVPAKEDLLRIHQAALVAQAKLEWKTSNELLITDVDGIVTLIQVHLGE